MTTTAAPDPAEGDAATTEASVSTGTVVLEMRDGNGDLVSRQVVSDPGADSDDDPQF